MPSDHGEAPEQEASIANETVEGELPLTLGAMDRLAEAMESVTLGLGADERPELPLSSGTISKSGVADARQALLDVHRTVVGIAERAEAVLRTGSHPALESGLAALREAATEAIQAAYLLMEPVAEDGDPGGGETR